MTIEEKEEIINSFNKLVSDTAKYQILEDADDIACAIINYFNATDKLTFEQKEIIIDTICLDYMANFNERSKPDCFIDAKEKFKSDITFAAEITSVYIDKYFYEDLVINRFNNLFLNYGDEEFTNENNISDVIYAVITKSSYFTDEEKKLVVNHLINECQDDIERRERFGELLDCSDDLIGFLTEESNDEMWISLTGDEALFIKLVDYYFNAYILEDFQLIKIENICGSVISDYIKNPTKEQLSRIYDGIILLDENYNYKDTILNIIDTVNNENKKSNELTDLIYFDDGDYELFVSDSSNGINVIKKYIEMTMLGVELINEVVRDSLKSLVSLENSIDENVMVVKKHFANINNQTTDNDQNYQKYGISPSEAMMYQKICLISDYYNRFSDNPLNCLMNSHVLLLRNCSQSAILHYFDTDQCFASFCIESFVEETLGVNYEDHGICKDADTLKKINPFYSLEQINNRAYQKKNIKF